MSPAQKSRENGKRTKEPQAVLVSVKEVNVIKVQDVLGLRRAKWLDRLISALESKLLGLAPAIIEPALIRWKANAEAYRIKKLASAVTAAESDRATQLSRARADALVADAKGVADAAQILRRSEDADIYVRAVNRIRAREVSNQMNLEQTIGKAIDRLLEDPSVAKVDPPRTPIDPDWVDRWIEGARWGSQESVQDIWARILASKARSPNGTPSLKLLEILRTVDDAMAKHFNSVGPQIYFTRFSAYGIFSNMKEKGSDADKLMNAELFTRLDLGSHNVYLQSCAIRINPERRIFFTAYRLSALGDELFEALHPGASKARELVRQNSFISKSNEARGDVRKVRRFISDQQFEAAGRQVLALLSMGFISSIFVLFPREVHGVERYDLQDNENLMAWEALYYKYMTARYKRRIFIKLNKKYKSSILIEVPNFAEALISQISPSDRSFVKGFCVRSNAGPHGDA